MLEATSATLALTGAASTVTASAPELLSALLASPAYLTLKLAVPTAKLLTDSVASPLLMLAVPKLVVPLKKLTVPVGKAAPLMPVIWATKVKACPAVSVLAELLSVLVVPARATVSVTAALALLALMASPEYTAVIALAPSPRLVRLKLALPETTLALPSSRLPLKKLTVPVGGVAVTPPDNVAVSLTGAALTLVRLDSASANVVAVRSAGTGVVPVLLMLTVVAADTLPALPALPT